MGPIERAQREQYSAAHKRIMTAGKPDDTALRQPPLNRLVLRQPPADRPVKEFTVPRSNLKVVVESLPVVIRIEELENSYAHEENSPPRVYDVQRAVCEYFGVRMSQILVTGGRRKQFVFARHIAIYLAAELCGRPLIHIGRRFSKMDHTSVIHARNRIAKRIKGGDQELFEAVQAIKAAIEQAGKPIDIPAFLPVRSSVTP